MNIVLGVAGSVSAYKACELVRLFVKGGHAVRVVMTTAAAKFVTPLTFMTLSQAKVVSGDLFGEESEGWMPSHIALAKFADVMCIAPCTANMIGKLAAGISDDALSATATACKAPLVIAPAMNAGMYEHPATAANLKILTERGVKIVEPGTGFLACGAVAKGRMPEPEEIYQAVINTAGAESAG